MSHQQFPIYDSDGNLTQPTSSYPLAQALTYYWDIGTLTWVKGEQGSGGVTTAVTVADGADSAEGSTIDLAVTSNAAGTISGKLRGLVAILADVWSSGSHWLRVDGSGVTQPVSGTFWQATQPVSGTVTAQQGTATSLKAQAEAYQGGTAVGAANPLQVSLANTAVNATAVKVDGSAATQPVSGTFWPATQPISGAVTVTSGSITVSGSVSVSSGTLTATITNDGTFAKESGGNLATVATNTTPLVTSGGGGYVRQDSTGTIAKESGGNLATVKSNTDPLVTSGAGGYVRQDSTATIAKESGGNLATVATNTTPLVTAAAGGYVRQDSTATMALESGGNLATLAGKDFATQTTLALLTKAQNAVASGILGPLVQSLVAINPPTLADATIAPLSLTQGGQLRTISATEESATAFSDAPDDPWNIHVGAMGFDLMNQITIDNVWES